MVSHQNHMKNYRTIWKLYWFRK